MDPECESVTSHRGSGTRTKAKQAQMGQQRLFRNWRALTPPPKGGRPLPPPLHPHTPDYRRSSSPSGLMGRPACSVPGAAPVRPEFPDDSLARSARLRVGACVAAAAAAHDRPTKAKQTSKTQQSNVNRLGTLSFIRFCTTCALRVPHGAQPVLWWGDDVHTIQSRQLLLACLGLGCSNGKHPPYCRCHCAFRSTPQGTIC